MQTPLAGLKTHADIALRSPDPETRMRSLDRISLSVDRTTRLVRQLLDLARQQSGIAPNDGQMVSLRVVFETIGHELESLLASHGVVLKLDDPPLGMVLPISEDALLLAVRNLVENAIIHGPQGAVVIVGATRSEGLVGFYVEDSGRGLASDEAHACTQPFVRGNRTSGPGSGLGFAIARAALANVSIALSFEQLQPTGFRITAAGPAR
jgi:two-component system sensor histidine kinase QseC